MSADRGGRMSTPSPLPPPLLVAGQPLPFRPRPPGRLRASPWAPSCTEGDNSRENFSREIGNFPRARPKKLASAFEIDRGQSPAHVVVVVVVVSGVPARSIARPSPRPGTVPQRSAAPRGRAKDTKDPSFAKEEKEGCRPSSPHRRRPGSGAPCAGLRPRAGTGGREGRGRPRPCTRRRPRTG